ncbi:MAG: hypothetical protein JWP01_2923 [Myxococcales bacterium]|nr:hypothetical protein [Myxococcales bacterium]
MASSNASAKPLRTGLLLGASTVELVGAGTACALALAALLGRAPGKLAAAVAIVLGGALLVHALAVTLRWKAVTAGGLIERYDRRSVGVSFAVDATAGAVVASLGILVVAGVVSERMLPLGAIVLGVAMLFGGAAQPQLTQVVAHRDTPVQDLAAHILVASDGLVTLGGLFAVTVGTFASLGIGPVLLLTLAGELGIAVVMLLVGGTLAARFADLATERP